MAWSFGHWLILIVALAVGAVAGWALRDRRGAAAAAGHTEPIVEGERDPVAAVVTTPAPTATVDEARPDATVDPAPTAVADHPVPGDALTEDRPTPAVDRPAPADAAAGDVDPADMVLTGDPVPAPRDEVPPAPPIDDAGRDTEVVLPVAAHLTGPVDTTPAAADDTDEVTTPVAAGPTTDTSSDALPTPVATDDEPSVPAAPVPAPRADVATPPARPTADAGGADDFRRIQGVGPKIAAALQAAGIHTYRQLADLDEAALREVVRSAGLRSAPGLATWPQQAKVLAGAPDTAAVLPGGTDA
ncbi:hypothetical protein [Micromonospora sp. NPDC049497]|uniref:hypothetical protein n=1 Tax=Micromonospora sp. NPDC049497 TaxID=3364273 RepID=UPI0037964000